MVGGRKVSQVEFILNSLFGEAVPIIHSPKLSIQSVIPAFPMVSVTAANSLSLVPSQRSQGHAKTFRGVWFMEARGIGIMLITNFEGAGEMPEELRVCTALVEDLSSNPKSMSGAHNCL